MKATVRAFLLRHGLMVTPEEKDRLRTLTFKDRMLEVSILQLLLITPFVSLAAWLWTGMGGLQMATLLWLGGLAAITIARSRAERAAAETGQAAKPVKKGPRRPGGLRPPAGDSGAPSPNKSKKKRK